MNTTGNGMFDTLHFYEDIPERYPESITRMRQVLNKKGFDASREHIERAWEAYSDSMCASWISTSIFPDDELFTILRNYLK